MDIDLNDPDAWDDSALTNSWNEALQEYKKYHSIHVKGQKLSEVLTKEELDLLRQNGVKVKHPANDATSDEVANAASHSEVNDNEEQPMDVEDGGPAAQLAAEALDHPVDAKASATSDASVPAGIPQAIMNSVQDESVRSLMMAWYWAGYYTGLHEGKASPES